MCKPLDEVVPPEQGAAQRSAAELAFMREIGRQFSEGECSQETLADILRASLHEVAGRFLRQAAELLDPATEDELNSKFTSEGELYFGDLSCFNAGLDATVGPPHPNLAEAMQREHTKRSDCKVWFVAGNYGVRTQSRIEWWFVADPEGKEAEAVLREEDLPPRTYPAETDNLSFCKRRYIVPLRTFDAAMAEVNAALRPMEMPPMRQEELIGARLYTGPLFVKYNAVMRGGGIRRPDWAKEELRERCQGNLYR